MKVVKTMNFELLKPIKISWDDLGKTLRSVEYAVWKTKNISIQMNWDYQNIAYGYQQRFGEKLGFDKLGTGRKRDSDLYQQSIKEFSYVGTSALNVATREATSIFNKHFKGVLGGETSIPSFKREQPIPIRAQKTKLTKEGGLRTIKFPLLSKSGAKERNLPTSFEVEIRTKGGALAIFDRLVSGEYRLCDSKILRKKNKWYASLSYSFEATEANLDPFRVMGVDLGVVKAAYMAFNFDDWLRYDIVGDEISEFRRRVEARRNALLQQAKYCGDGRKGHGRKTRIKPIEKLRGKVDNFRRTKNHVYSKYIVDIAEKNGCGTIQFEDLSGINNREKFLANWSYFELQTFVEYKAKERGIAVKKINPRYTSQRCSCCGHIAEENRETQAQFKCVACGFKSNADFNAAKNIAEPNIERLIETELGRRKTAS
ncbi:RNA-guided endonuclease TnpB family protein [Alkalihalobacillus sp. LMS6]|jgi:IS605 OrfB family transposase|uniref:RNA-guided endonuclease TnpB family protein n=1 Tax=Alkalihalobacillus sp. LMS6 TaxID=2924034 RepID=UPI0020D18AD0|nr:RNA-guided endonuclease TnpB family protein [Alkalihalobacillus sp. LMS6]UTR05190.1 RNA-guided endonuclease TnpB family protein [Alkalihalobacillus sp. LMS6]